MSISLNDMSVTRAFLQNVKKSVFDNETIEMGSSVFDKQESIELVNMLEDALIDRTAPMSLEPKDPSAWISALINASQSRDYTMVGGGEFEHRELKSVLNVLKFYRDGFEARRQLLMNVKDQQDARLVDYHMQLAALMIGAYQSAQEYPNHHDIAPHNPATQDPERLAWGMPLLLAYQMDLSRSSAEGQQQGKWYPEILKEVSSRWSVFLDVKEQQPTDIGQQLNADYVATTMPSRDMKKLAYTFNEMIKYRDSIAGTGEFRVAISYLIETLNNDLCVDLSSRLDLVDPLHFNKLLRCMRSDKSEMSDILPKWQGQVPSHPYGAAVGSITGLYAVEFMDDILPNHPADLEYDELVVAAALLTLREQAKPVPVEFLGSETPILRVAQNASFDVTELRWVMKNIEADSLKTELGTAGLSIADLLVVAAKLEQIGDHLSESFRVHSHDCALKGRSVDAKVRMRLMNSVQNLKETSASIRLFTAKQYLPSPLVQGQPRLSYSDQQKIIRPSGTYFMVAYDQFLSGKRTDLEERRRKFIEQTSANSPLSFRVNASPYSVFTLPAKDRIFHTLNEAKDFIEHIPDEFFSDLPVSKSEVFDIRKVHLSDHHLMVSPIDRSPKFAALLWTLNAEPNAYKNHPIEQQLLIHADAIGVFVPETLKAAVQHYAGGYSDLALALPHVLKQMDSESLSDVIDSINYNGEYKNRPEVTQTLDDGEHLAVSAPRLSRR